MGAHHGLTGWPGRLRRLLCLPPQHRAGIPDDSFEIPLKDGAVSLEDLVLANVARSPLLTPEQGRRAVGEHYYPLLRAKFLQEHENAQIIVQESAGLGVCLFAGDDGELEHFTLRRTIRYDWTSARLLAAEVNELDEEARRWLPQDEKHGMRLRLFELMTRLDSSIAHENKQHIAGGTVGVPPTQHLATDLDTIRPSIAQTRRDLQQDAQRAAQLVYARGMGRGAGLLGLLCIVLALIFLWQHIPAVYGVGVIAGGGGAILSVFRRMTSGKLTLDYKSDPKMLRLFGGIRPFVGAVFGTITLCIIKAGLLPERLMPPTTTGALLAFVAVFAFGAGFNEQFFQDMLQSATKAGGESISADEAGKTS
jgi:hypothetical protein